MTHPTAWARTVQRYPATGDTVPPQARHLLLLLATHCYRDASCAVLTSTLAAEMGVTDRTVRRALAELREGGLVTVTRRRRRSNEFALVLPELDAAPVTDAPDEIAPELIEPVEDVEAVEEPAPLTVADLRTELCGPVLDALLGEMSITEAFLTALAEARTLGADFADLSANVTGTLLNGVLARAAAETHEIPVSSLPRLYREAKILGGHGPEAIVTALTSTASAAINGDPTSYVIAAARRVAADAKGVAA
jgi:DNA-binding transcriptional ArsR family regulator